MWIKLPLVLFNSDKVIATSAMSMLIEITTQHPQAVNCPLVDFYQTDPLHILWHTVNLKLRYKYAKIRKFHDIFRAVNAKGIFHPRPSNIAKQNSPDDIKVLTNTTGSMGLWEVIMASEVQISSTWKFQNTKCFSISLIIYTINAQRAKHPQSTVWQTR